MVAKPTGVYASDPVCGDVANHGGCFGVLIGGVDGARDEFFGGSREG